MWKSERVEKDVFSQNWVNLSILIKVFGFETKSFWLNHISCIPYKVCGKILTKHGFMVTVMKKLWFDSKIFSQNTPFIQFMVKTFSNLSKTFGYSLFVWKRINSNKRFFSKKLKIIIMRVYQMILWNLLWLFLKTTINHLGLPSYLGTDSFFLKFHLKVFILTLVLVNFRRSQVFF